MADGVKVTFIGGPTVLLDVAGKRFLTDPTFSPAGTHETTPGRPLTKTEGPALSAEDVGPVDAVLLSHDQHADNLDPDGKRYVERALLTLTTPSGARRLGGTAQGLAPWHQLHIGPVSVTAVPARHGPKGSEDVVGEVIGFVLTGQGLPSVYVSGDNASLDVVRDVSRRLRKLDLAVLFAGAARTSLFDGAPLTLTSEDAAEAAQILRPRAVVPVHTRGWAHFSEGPDEVRKAFAGAGLGERLHVLEPGESAQLG